MSTTKHAYGDILWACSTDTLGDATENEDGSPITIDQYLRAYAVCECGEKGELKVVSLRPYKSKGDAYYHASVHEASADMKPTKAEAIEFAIKDLRGVIADIKRTIDWLQTHL